MIKASLFYNTKSEQTGSSLQNGWAGVRSSYHPLSRGTDRTSFIGVTSEAPIGPDIKGAKGGDDRFFCFLRGLAMPLINLVNEPTIQAVICI